MAAMENDLARIAGCHFEYIFIDDGSTDTTLARLRQLVASGMPVKIIELSRNFGKEAALSAGIDHAEDDAVIPIDVDLQDPPCHCGHDHTMGGRLGSGAGTAIGQVD